MKKAVLIAILAIATVVVAMAQIGKEFYDDNSGLYFRVTSLNPNEVKVIKKINYYYYTGNINIPSSVSYDGANYSVTAIGNEAFDGCGSLTTVNIGNSVTTIGKGAFSRCSSLISINIPNSVTTIGGEAFRECSKLTSINIPNSVTEIGERAFADCSSLTTVNIGNSVTTIGNQAFARCSSLTSIDIPNSVTTIGGLAFAESGIADINVDSSNPRFASDNGILFSKNMDTLICYPQGKTNSTYTIPGSVTTIGGVAFAGCGKLTSIDIPNSVTSIGNQAFEECSSLTTANIGNSVNTIGEGAFYKCMSLTSIDIPNSVTAIGRVAFYNCSSLTTANIGNSVNTIGIEAFYKCMSLTSIDIPNSVTSIGNLAFGGCSSLTTVNIGNSVTSIGNSAFSSCSNLTMVNIGNSVTTIGSYAFWDCTKLTSIDIPNSVITIGRGAFSRCSSLTSINIPNSVTSIGNEAFYKCSNLKSVDIGNSVTEIGQQAFADCSSLTTVNIGNSVTTIGNEAFYKCRSLTTVNIGNSVTTIGNEAFSWCSSLKSVDIGNSVTEIGQQAFADCSSLKKIKIDVTNPASITLGNNVFIYIPKGTSADACILLVPPGSVPDYSNAPQWKEFMPNILEPQNFAITYNQPVGGTLAILNDDDDSSITSGSQVEHGDVIKVVATPDNGYHLDGIKVNGTPTANNSTITIKQHTTIEAFFSLNKYRIEYDVKTGGGTLVVLNAANGSYIPYGSQVEHGDVIKIVATPDNGYQLSKIVVNDEPFTGTEITVKRDTYIYAEFAQGTGIDHSDYMALSIYPTLASEYITVATEVGSSPVPVTVTDLSGHTVATAIATGSKTVINISHLSAGTYIVRIGDKVGKVVKR